MMVRLKKISINFYFRNPERKPVIIFHREHTDILRKFILFDIDYTVLDADGDVLHITPHLIALMIKNLRYLVRSFHIAKTTLSGRLYKIYLLSFIEYTKPKIVITLIDNSYLFQWVSRIYKKAEFYAIENGARNDVRGASDIMSMPNLFCFGNYDIDVFRNNGHLIDNYYPVGSLFGGYYKTEVSPSKVNINYEICMVSQWEPSILSNDSQPGRKDAFKLLDQYLNLYVNNHSCSMCIATRSNEYQVLNYYKTIYGKSVHIIQYDKFDFTTYKAMDFSSIIIASNSTAAVEAFGWGKKTLFCTLSRDKRYSYPVEDYCSVKTVSYDEFEKKLDFLRNMDYNVYLKSTERSRKYLMNYDFSMPAHKYIRNMILKRLGK